jgi:hypothetical protein
MYTPRFFVLAGMILAAAASRLVPHPHNFAPVTAMALFGGACFLQKRWAFVVPLAAMFLSDLVIGFRGLVWADYAQMGVGYGCLALIVPLGFWLQGRRKLLPIVGATLGGSFVFFVVTNFAVWALQPLYPVPRYPSTMEGLGMCFTQALPFFWNTLRGDAVYATALFGGLALIENWLPVLRETLVPSAEPGRG